MLLKKFQRWSGVMGAQQTVLTAAVHLKMIKMINLMVGVFCHNKTYVVHIYIQCPQATL